MEISQQNLLYPSLMRNDTNDNTASMFPGPVTESDSTSRKKKPWIASGSKRLQWSDMNKEVEDDLEKIKVHLRVVFLKVGEINTLKEKYAADIFLQARWQQSKNFTLTNEDGETEPWNPQLQIENVLGDAKEEEWQYTDYLPNGKIVINECRRVKGVFVENLELQHFPFDTQDLSLTISTELSETELELVEDKDELSSVNKQSFVDEQEWALYEHVEMFPKVSMKEYTSSKEQHPTMLVMCHAARRPGFFLWNIFLIMMLITLLAFATFAVQIDKVQNRLQLSFTLVLTGVAFKFVVNQSLPRISYLTYMDKYILSSMVYLCLVCVWHSVIGRLHNDRNDPVAEDLDWKALISFGGIYLASHLFFSAWIYKNAWRRRRLMEKKDEAYREKVIRCREEATARHALKRRRPSAWSPAVSMPKFWESPG